MNHQISHEEALQKLEEIKARLEVESIYELVQLHKQVGYLINICHGGTLSDEVNMAFINAILLALRIEEIQSETDVEFQIEKVITDLKNAGFWSKMYNSYRDSWLAKYRNPKSEIKRRLLDDETNCKKELRERYIEEIKDDYIKSLVHAIEFSLDFDYQYYYDWDPLLHVDGSIFEIVDSMERANVPKQIINAFEIHATNLYNRFKAQEESDSNDKNISNAI